MQNRHYTFFSSFFGGPTYGEGGGGSAGKAKCPTFSEKNNFDGPPNNETSRLACLYLPGSLSDRQHSCHCGPDHQPRLHSAPDLDGDNDDDGPDGDDGDDGDDDDD